MTDWNVRLYTENCFKVLKALEPQSVDAVVTDPPYEFGFMGKAWDRTGIAYSDKLWAWVMRCMKPGAHLLAFGAPRACHRMTCAIEDAGFEIRDQLMWVFGTGFPKSMDVGDGRGTAIKPAYEPVVLARKPLRGTVEANVSRYGTGALNIDACRIGTEARFNPAAGNKPRGRALTMSKRGMPQDADGRDCVGRWPANVMLDDEAARVLDEQTGTLRSGGLQSHHKRNAPRLGKNAFNSDAGNPESSTDGRDYYKDSGGASRFFYVAKASTSERDIGCDHLPMRTGGEMTNREDGSPGALNPRAGAGHSGGRNYHPTVKPVELMRWLVRLVTPANGIVLDPFMGSGTTGMAALMEERRFIGVECNPGYMEIAKARISAAERSAA